MKDLINVLWSKIKTHVIYILIICLLMLCLSISVNKCSNTSREYKHNIEALNDTIKYYQDKNGNLVATKLAFESDIKTLKLLNKDLYDQIDSMNLNPKVVQQIIYVGGEIENPGQDTSYVVNPDTISKGFTKEFDLDEDSRIYVKSTNPYVKYNEISGFTVPKQRNKRWNIGPAIHGGYDPINKNWSISAGVSITFGLIQW